jgi:hypothetical protein
MLRVAATHPGPIPRHPFPPTATACEDEGDWAVLNAGNNAFVGAFSEHRTLPGGLSKVRHPFGLLVCYF